MPRKIKIKPRQNVPACPKCGNNTEFTIHSNQCGEDCCEIWAVCKCGYDPTLENHNYRVEDVWGGTSDGNCIDAIRFAWGDTITDLAQTKTPITPDSNATKQSDTETKSVRAKS